MGSSIMLARYCFAWVYCLRRIRFQPCSQGVYGCVVSHACVELRAVQAGDMNLPASVLVHLCSAADWRAGQAAGELRPKSLDENGFVHLSTPEQVHLPANRIYGGRTDLVLLHIDAARLTSPIRWEPGVATDPASMVFPHLYGPLPAATVITVTSYRPGADGWFAPLTG
jgi:uncharacterized protein (DUF952 family)